MSNAVTAYPLTWPATQPRTKSRARATFGMVGPRGPDGGLLVLSRQRLTVAQALARLDRELRLVGAAQVVISTNLRLRQDGLPRSDQRAPEDVGVAVYFTLDRKPHCLACDQWDRVADNLAAIAKHLEAMRGMERWGVGSRAQAFAGYAALPASSARPWREVLGVSPEADLATAEAAYRHLARAQHPDAGGSHDAMAELTRAIAEARRALAPARVPA